MHKSYQKSFQEFLFSSNVNRSDVFWLEQKKNLCLGKDFSAKCVVIVKFSAKRSNFFGFEYSTKLESENRLLLWSKTQAKWL